MLAEFRKRDWMWLAVAPEGTRSYTDHLKSGFYQLAVAANIPIGLAYIDYGRRQVGIDTYVRMTGDREQDLDGDTTVLRGQAGARAGPGGQDRAAIANGSKRRR